MEMKEDLRSSPDSLPDLEGRSRDNGPRNLDRETRRELVLFSYE